MHRLASAFAGLMLAGVATAQTATATALREQLARATAGSETWFATSCELVEAGLACDLATAVADAQQLVEACRQHGDDGRRTTADALLQLARAMFEGPARAGAIPDVDAEPAAATDAATLAQRARVLTAHARTAWLGDRPTEFLAHAFPALAAARGSHVGALRVRAAFMLHTVLERDAAAFDAALLAEIEPLLAAADASGWRPWFDLNQYWRASGTYTREERLAAAAAIARRADAIGDLRTRVHAEWDRAVCEMAAEQYDGADAAVETARIAATRLGDRRLLAVTLELAAEFALERAQLDAAATRLAEAATVVADRGYPDRDVQQAHLRLRLASQRNDAAASATETRRLEDLRKAETARYRGYAPLREQLLQAERQRLTAAADRARALDTAWLVGGITAATALAVIAFLGVRGRRRLQQKNSELHEQMARTAVATAAREVLERRLRELERADGLGALASGVAHEFNNLIAVVLGNAELLRDEASPDERQQLLTTIVTAGQRGAALCKQLQACGRRGGSPADVDVGAMLERLAPALRAAVGEGGELTVTRDPASLRVHGAAAELEQAIVHLVTNSRDAGARRIAVHVEALAAAPPTPPKTIVHGELRAGAYLRLAITDDGEGITPDRAERVFEPFFTTRFAGRGLGLAVVSAIARRHGGAITLASEPGRGACFALLLPLADAAAATATTDAAPTAEPAAGDVAVGPMAVLLIEDEEPVRDFVTRALQRRGHRAIVAANSDALANSLAELPVDPRSLALVDLTMPGTDGRDVVRQLRERRPELPIVLMSGHAGDRLAGLARELAADGCLAKPFRTAELERTLSAALRRRRRGA